MLGATYFMSLNVLTVYFCPCFTAEEIEALRDGVDPACQLLRLRWHFCAHLPSSRVLLDARQLCFPSRPTVLPLDKATVTEMQRAGWEKDRILFRRCWLSEGRALGTLHGLGVDGEVRCDGGGEGMVTL